MKKLKGILRELRRQWFYKLIVAGLVGLGVCLVTFLGCGHEGVSYLSLNYPEALQGQYLNGTRLNMYDILSEETLQLAINKAGLQDVLTPWELGSMISVSPRHSSNPVDKYTATEFEVDLYLDQPILGVDSRGLLKMVCMAFIENFYGTHSNNQSLLQFSLSDMDDLDYNEVGMMFQTKIDLMADYIEYRYASNPDFLSQETGESFSSLRTQIADFSGVILEKYNAYVQDNGITKDEIGLSASLDYEQILLWKSYNKTILNYDMRIAAINAYDTLQSAIVMIPTVDTTGEFYMSKTRTGIDYLAEQANVAMNKAKTVKMRIDRDAALLEKTNASSAVARRKTIIRTEEMIDEVIASIDELEKLVIRTDNDFIRQETAESLVYRMREPTTRDLYEFKESLLAAVAAYLLLSLLNWAMMNHTPRRKRKAGYTNA